MTNFLYAIIIAFSFFTIMPLPKVEWTKERIGFLPVLMPFVGLGIAAAAFMVYILLSRWNISTFGSSVVLTLFFLVITGGLHVDGLMDMADAYFSRRCKESKLAIMKDSQVGAFAVMVFVALLLFKTACFYEILAKKGHAMNLLLFVPLLSRTGQAYILCRFPYAKQDGLAVLFGAGIRQGTSAVLILYFMLSGGLLFLLAGFKSLFLPAGLLFFTLFYYYSTKRNFGGITGDIAGAYVELAEVLMLFLLTAF